MKKKVITNVLICFVTLIIVNILFFVFMMLTYKIPTQGRIKENVGNSLYTLQNEQVSPFFNNPKEYWNDFGSDMIWINMATVQTDDPVRTTIILPRKRAVNFPEEGERTYYDLIQALYYPENDELTSTASYSRYWMLTVGLLRILFLFWKITDIRAFLLYINIFLVLWLLYMVTKELNWRGFISLSVAMALRLWILHSLCLSTMADILLTTSLMLFVIYHYKRNWFKEYGFLCYLIQGSLSFAVGPLVAPLLTLGMPLILQVLLTKSHDKDLKSWWAIIRNSICWIMGYAGTLFVKAALAKIVSGSESSSEQVTYYLGFGQGVGTRFYRIWYCIEGVLEPKQVKLPLICILLIILLGYMLKKGICKFQSCFQVLFITLYPVVWSFVIVEHSIHYFVANIFSIFVFGVLALITFHIKE